jgi:hypothetical protein
VTFISLRKHAPEPEPDEDLEETEETPDDEEQPPDKPASYLGALAIGICGPAQWIAGRFGTGTAWASHGIALWAIGHYGGWTAFTLVTGYLLAVLLFIPREHLERAATAVEQLGDRRQQLGGEDAASTGEEPLLHPIVTVLWELIADAPGVHLKTLAKHLQAAAPEQPVDRAQVRAKLAALSIPVRGSVRDATGRVNEGVHRADLTAWQQALPRAAPGAPSEARSGPVATPVTCDVGNRSGGVATPLSRIRRGRPRGAA